MNAREYGASILLIVAVMAVVALLEAVVPLVARPPSLPGRRRTNLAMTAQVFLCTFGFTSAAAVAAASWPWRSPCLLGASGLPAAVQIFLAVVVLDFAYGYVAHRTMHVSPALWRYHRVHHSDPFVDVTTSYRTHPVEIVWRHLWLFLAAWIVGAPAAAVVIFRVASAMNGILEHANLRIWPRLDTLVSWIWVTPNMHKIHHSRVERETDSNYGNLFALHDRVLGTFVPTNRAASVRYGLDDVDPAEIGSLTALVTLPWRRESPATAAAPRATA
jgi:sterol desaturase/sphingolipid hydroxylase (fatty acid hydroxylase superfamily)